MLGMVWKNILSRFWCSNSQNYYNITWFQFKTRSHLTDDIICLCVVAIVKDIKKPFVLQNSFRTISCFFFWKTPRTLDLQISENFQKLAFWRSKLKFQTFSFEDQSGIWDWIKILIVIQNSFHLWNQTIHGNSLLTLRNRHITRSMPNRSRHENDWRSCEQVLWSIF